MSMETKTIRSPGTERMRRHRERRRKGLRSIWLESTTTLAKPHRGVNPSSIARSTQLDDIGDGSVVTATSRIV
jgi:hypothetical protein